MEDEDNIKKIHLQLRDIDQPFSMHVRRDKGEEKLFRTAADMINRQYDDYKSKVKDLDSTSCYAMICLLFARLYLDSNAREQETKKLLQELEEKVVARFDNKKEDEGGDALK